MKRKKKKEFINWRQLGLELLVVFLGVTAGFILNNWRSSAQENQLRDKYLTSFHRDISQNIEDLKKSIDADSYGWFREMPTLSKWPIKLSRPIRPESSCAPLST